MTLAFSSVAGQLPLSQAATIGCLSQSADFERVLGTRTRVSSLHFALHHLADQPSRFRRPSTVDPVKLSTGEAQPVAQPVDDSPVMADPEAGQGAARVWLGTVVPKRHARRSVTRSLLKRQMRHAVAGCQPGLSAGLWVLRLRAPFDRTMFPSAASEAMKQVARAELQQLLADAVASPGRPWPAARRRR